MKYKVLSVRQPYASLLVSGEKDVENRSRSTSYRGTVLIHASAKMHDVYQFLKRKKSVYPLTSFDERLLEVCKTVEAFPDTLLSAIIGSVDIINCVVDYPSGWAELGQWNWVCANARMFEHPIINVKGKLGLWEWEGNIE